MDSAVKTRTAPGDAVLHALMVSELVRNLLLVVVTVALAANVCFGKALLNANECLEEILRNPQELPLKSQGDARGILTVQIKDDALPAVVMACALVL
jgi:hypothetical protein